MDPKTRGGVHGWLAYPLLGLAVIAASYLVPEQGTGRAARVALYCLVNVSAAAALGYGLWRHRPPQWLPWLLLGVSQLVCVGADISVRMAHLFGVTVPWPAVDLLYLSHYPLLVVALSLLVRARTPGRDLPGLLERACCSLWRRCRTGCTSSSRTPAVARRWWYARSASGTR